MPFYFIFFFLISKGQWGRKAKSSNYSAGVAYAQVTGWGQLKASPLPSHGVPGTPLAGPSLSLKHTKIHHNGSNKFVIFFPIFFSFCRWYQAFEKKKKERKKKSTHTKINPQTTKQKPLSLQHPPLKPLVNSTILFGNFYHGLNLNKNL